MGFFSDLKDDLSQAVNELMPEEGAEEEKQETVQSEAPISESKDDFNMDLSEMLDQMDVGLPAGRNRYGFSN